MAFWRSSKRVGDTEPEKPVQKVTQILVHVKFHFYSHSKITFFTLVVQEVSSPHIHQKIIKEYKEWNGWEKGKEEWQALSLLRDLLSKEPFNLNQQSTPPDQFKIVNFNGEWGPQDIPSGYRENFKNAIKAFEDLNGKKLSMSW